MRTIWSLAVVVLLLCGVRTSVAQALPGASKSMDFGAFGGYQYAKPDFGPDTNTGGTVGVDVTRYYNFFLEPSLEVRGNYSSGNTITEKSLVGGLRGEHRLHDRYYPYVDFLYGGGSLRYSHLLGPLYGPDRGSVFSYGAGIDIDAYKHIQIKVDAQNQHWNLGPNFVTAPNKPNYTLSPFMVMVGINYRIPFPTHKR